MQPPSFLGRDARCGVPLQTPDGRLLSRRGGITPPTGLWSPQNYVININQIMAGGDEGEGEEVRDCS